MNLIVTTITITDKLLLNSDVLNALIVIKIETLNVLIEHLQLLKMKVLF